MTICSPPVEPAASEQAGSTKVVSDVSIADTVVEPMTQTSFDLALSTLGVSQSAPPRSVIEWAARSGFRGILLDAARSGLRPRELDRSARRGIASLLRRLELDLGGVELWIPTEHYASPEHNERAINAACSAIDLAADLAGLTAADRTLTLTLPAEGADEAVETIAHAAHRAEVRLANAGKARGNASAGAPDGAPIGRCLDPRAIISGSEDPIEQVLASVHAPAAARWAFSSRRPEEVADPLAYASALSIAGFQGSVALDLRDAIDPETDAIAALDRWRHADPFAA